MRTLTHPPPPSRCGKGSNPDASPSRLGRGTEGVGRGFTIIEVMVAMLIFAIAVVSIFGAQFSAISTTEFARHTTMAAELARCRMSELELEFVQNGGFQEGDVAESGACCEALDGDANAAEYTCRWDVKTIVLPDATQLTAGGADGGVGGGMLGDLLGGGMGGDDEQASQDALGLGGDMVSAFLPTVTQMLQQAIRRVTVTVEWELANGERRDLAVVQYVVHPTQGPLQLLQQVNAAGQMAEEQQGALDATGAGRGGER